MSPSAAPLTPGLSGSNQANYQFALVSLTSLFFMWGFITCLNDILIPHLKAVFDLSYMQAMLVQFCFFGAYFIVSLPAGKLLAKIGYQKGIVIGLTIAALGCLLFYPAAILHNYSVFLMALFVLASGITLLQVSANPYVSLLGDSKTASSRLTMTQAFNSLGTTVAPFFGAYLILETAIDTAASADSVKIPYLLLAAMLFLLAAVFAKLKLPQIQNENTQSSSKRPLSGALSHKHLTLGAVGIFVYVGAEVSIGSFLVSYFGDLKIDNITEATAAKYIAYYWGGAMVGRFIGAAVMQKIEAGKVLAFNSFAAVILIMITMLTTGKVAMFSVLLVGLCNSIMFPTIFSLALNKLGEDTANGSGILCLAIVGGAIVPVLQGGLADSIGIQQSFVLPIFCYVFIAYYGLKGSKVEAN